MAVIKERERRDAEASEAARLRLEEEGSGKEEGPMDAEGCGIAMRRSHLAMEPLGRKPQTVQSGYRTNGLIGGKMLERKQFRQRVPTEDIDHRTRELLIALLREIHTPRDAKHIFHRLAHGSP